LFEFDLKRIELKKVWKKKRKKTDNLPFGPARPAARYPPPLQRPAPPFPFFFFFSR
jgi:hypothetical protein